MENSAETIVGNENYFKSEGDIAPHVPGQFPNVGTTLLENIEEVFIKEEHNSDDDNSEQTSLDLNIKQELNSANESSENPLQNEGIFYTRIDGIKLEAKGSSSDGTAFEGLQKVKREGNTTTEIIHKKPFKNCLIQPRRYAESYQCLYCEEKFKQAGSLQTHLLDHRNIYKCTRCDKEYRKLSCFKTHVLTHSDIKAFSCTQCGKKYSRATSLKRHSLMHTSLIPNKCMHCGKKFGLLNSQKRCLLCAC